MPLSVFSWTSAQTEGYLLREISNDNFDDEWELPLKPNEMVRLRTELDKAIANKQRLTLHIDE